MTNYARVQGKVFKGYAKAASVLGSNYYVYRSTTGLDPISPDSLFATVPVSANVAWNYLKANKYGNNVWQLLIDGRIVNVGDYLIEISTINDILPSTFFVAAKQELLPILGVSCNKTVSVTRPAYKSTEIKGNIGTGGYRIKDAITIMSNCPASFLMTSKGESNPTALPSDPKLSWFDCFLPYLGNTYIYLGDIIEESATGQRYFVMNNEKTDLGWRLLLQVLGT